MKIEPLTVLFLFYVVLIIIHFFCKKNPINSKFIKRIEENDKIASSYSFCHSDKECVIDYICFRNKCIPKLRTGDSCDAITGDWTIVEKENEKLFVACTCKYPNIITQKFIGSNCDLDIACGPIGEIIKSTIESQNMRCRCPFGYKSIPTNKNNNKPSCIKMSVVEMAESNEMGPCEEDQVEVIKKSNPIFNKAYFKNFSPRCTKRPCSFDALSGKPIKNARFIPNFGCVCDPKRGNVGVRINHPNYLSQSVPGYNACINIFNVEPLHDIKNVRLYSYFYIFDKMPVSFIQYYDLDPSLLASPFKNISSSTNFLKILASPSKNISSSTNFLQIEETWPYDYMQHVLQKFNFKAHTRYAIYHFYDHRYMYSDEMILSHVEYCENIPRSLSEYNQIGENAYRLFYKYIVCKMREGTPVFGGHFVSNPFHVTFRDNTHPIPHRSNGLMMEPDDKNEDKIWNVYLAPSNQNFIDGILLNSPSSKIPNFNDKIKTDLI